MLHMFKRTTLCLAIAAACFGAPKLYGFALVGPALGYETDPLGYSAGDFPQNIGDENRVTVPNFFYASDQSFLDFFGQRGREEVAKAVNYLNDLPAFSSMSEDLSEFPQVTYRENFRAGALGLSDLKSQVMNMLLTDFGLTNPEYYMWSVRDRVLPAGAECPNYNWIIIVRNFDPVTWGPSSYVNGALYTYQWVLSCSPAPDLTHPSPVLVDPTAYGFSAVAGGLLANRGQGQYFSGFSRDDIAGLRYLYRSQNYNFESLPGNVLAGVGGGVPWSIVDPNPTNVPAATAGLRGGLDKFTFEERPYDSLLSQFFVGFTNGFSSTLITNGTALSQAFGRPVLVPDIIFSADNLDVTVDGGYTVYGTSGPGFSNGGTGPGTIDLGGGVPLNYVFNKIGAAFAAGSPSFLSEASLIPELRWGSYDGTTNQPVAYPSGTSIRDLESLVLGQ